MNDLLKQLTELVPLAAAATAGPWERPDDATYQVRMPRNADGLSRRIADMRLVSDAAFIAAARNVLTPGNLTLITTQQEQIAKLQAFKDFVHATLDAADIDKHEEQNATTGCRIGARLRDLIGDASQAKHSYHCAQQAYAREMDAIIARDNAQASLQALRAALAPQWVSVAEQLPERMHDTGFGIGADSQSKDVLICRSVQRPMNTPCEVVKVARYYPGSNQGKGGWLEADSHNWVFPHHWMPLPTPPALTEGAQPNV